LLALTIVALLAFLGLAIDVGMLAIAKTQAQNAADLAALTAARTLTGNSSNTYNSANATSNAQNILAYNAILGQTIPTVTPSYGSYDYNDTTQTFNANFPATSGQPYSAVAVTVSITSLPGAFSTVLGNQFLPNVSATAQAVHRPRDIALVMDLSSSMRYGTCLGFDITNATRATNNPDTVVPKFGHYAGNSSLLIGTSSNQTSSYDSYTITPSNTTVGNSSYALTYINGFYQSAAYAPTLIRAFDSYSSTDLGNTWTAPTSQHPQLPGGTPTSTTNTVTPGGDAPLFLHGSVVTYAKNANDVVGNATGASPGTRNKWWELDGYSGCTSGTFNNADLGTWNYASGSFNGYTQGPGYYGKTFFIWPPDPRRPLNTVTATSWSSTANDTATIKQFLTDFGYTAADFNSTSVTTTLSAAITNAQTSITVASGASFPASGQFRIVVGSEIMVVTAGNGTGTWTVTRGADGTTAAAAAKSAQVGLSTANPLNGIFTKGIKIGGLTTAGWPWPAGDDGTGTIAGSLSNYLVNYVYQIGPSSSKLPAATSASAGNLTSKLIMRLYNWNYVVDNTGTTPCDWRIRFFGTNNNNNLFNGSGSLNQPGGVSGGYTAIQTYNAILSWLTTSMDPFPTQLRAGRIKYYGSIPSAITGSWPSYGGTDQRFWVEVIDHILGYRQTSAGNYTDISAMAGYGSDFTWGTSSTNAQPSATQYMDYSDIPLRPLLRHWFSPILMVDYLQNYNMYENTSGYWVMQPGDSYEAPIYTGRQAYVAAINTMQNNHPNDWFTMITYSQPRSSQSDTTMRFNCARSPLGTNYAYATSALLFPFSTIKANGANNGTEITPYDPDPADGTTIPSPNFMDTPRAKGGTSFSMGLVLAYNQFIVTPTTDTWLRTFVTNTPITFPTGMAGGLGRKGAQRVVIFETDGLANTSVGVSLAASGKGYNYYPVRYDMNRPSSSVSEYPNANQTSNNDPGVLSEVYSYVDQLKADFGTSRNPFRLYTVGFGPVFSGADAAAALSTLQTMQFHAGTQNNAATPLPSNQIITGSDATMSSNMITTFTNILQNGVQIALIK